MPLSAIALLSSITSASVAFLFLAASVTKLLSMQQFAQTVRNYRLGSPKTAAFLAQWIPLAEVAVGLLLISGMSPRLAGLAAAGILLTFAAAVAANIVRGRAHISCGCFGGRDSHLTWTLVCRNVLLVVLVAGVPIADKAIDHIGPSYTIQSAIDLIALTVACAILNVRGMSLLRPNSTDAAEPS